MTVERDRTTRRERRLDALDEFATAGARTSAQTRVLPLLGPALAAVAVFWIAFDGGSYSLQSRSATAIVLLWLLSVGTLSGLLPLHRAATPLVVCTASLAAFAALAALSARWAPSVEKAVYETNRIVLYLAVVVVVGLVTRRGSAAVWSRAIAVGITGVAAVALTSYAAPNTLGEPLLSELIPAAAYRLSYPLNYWNGLAVFSALAFPLLLGAAVGARSPAGAGAWIAPIPLLAAVVYLTASRGGILTSVVGVFLFLALTARRWRAAVATAVAAAGATLAVAIIRAQPPLVADGGAEPAAAGNVTILVAVACLTAAAAFAGIAALQARIRITVPSKVSIAALVVVVLALLAAAARVDPAAGFERFRSVPSDLEYPESGGETHLLSGSGNGRWQMWVSAVEAFRAAPLRGQGAGAFEYWWAQNGSLPGFVLDAHSLYLETLGELGFPGLAMVLIILGTGVVTGVVRLRNTRPDTRVTLAAIVGGFGAYVVEVAFDWMWELTAVTVVAFALLALLVGEASASGEPEWRAPLRPSMRAATSMTCLVLVLVQAVPMLADANVRTSRARAEAGDIAGAMAAAREAHSLQPYSATPPLQLALLSESAGHLGFAEVWIRAAISRDEQNWRLWIVAARIQTKRGDIEAATRSLDRALALSPRSPLFASLR
ncbi:MAG TPA: O-antigen ligase family protein [Gaiellaceae bacterium]|nr:O-antigen ligase family protein [Gaiellaceae bacterium]